MKEALASVSLLASQEGIRERMGKFSLSSCSSCLCCSASSCSLCCSDSWRNRRKTGVRCRVQSYLRDDPCPELVVQ